jgi:tetratricopeptide (TPR) repeat protein
MDGAADVPTARAEVAEQNAGTAGRRIIAEYGSTADPAVLRRGGAALETLAARTSDPVDRLNLQIDLAVVLGTLADAEADEELFVASSSWFERTAADGDADELTLSRCWSNWALAELAQARRLGRPALVDQAAEHAERALRAALEPGDARTWALSAGGSVYLRLYQVGGDLADLDRAEERLREAIAQLQEADPDDPDLPQALRCLAVVLGVRFLAMGGGRRADHEEAVALLREAVERTASGTLDRYATMAVLGGALVEGAQVGGERSLAEGLALLTAAHEAAHGPERDLIAPDLAAALLVAFQWNGDRSTLDTAVRVLSTSQGAATPATEAARASRLGAVLAVRHDAFADPADLDRALDLLEQAHAVDVLRGDDAVQLLSDLGGTLLQRFDVSGHPGDLDRAIDVLEDALERVHARTSALALRVLLNLGTAYLTHHEVFGDLESIDAAVRCLDEPAPGTTTVTPERGGWLASRGVAYQARFRARGDESDIRTAVDTLRAAVAGFGADVGHDLPTRETGTAVSNLAEALGLLAGTRPDGDPERRGLLNEAVRWSRTATQASEATDIDRALRLTNLGSLLMRLHDEEPSEALRTEASQALQKAVDLTPPDQPRRVIYLSNLASFHFTVGLHDDDPDADVVRAVTLLQEAAMAETGGVLHRIWAAYTWAQLASKHGDLDQALDGYRTAVTLVPDLAGRRLNRGDREQHLAGIAELARDAAACALQRRGATDAIGALDLLEQGRGVLLQQALRGRDPGGLLRRLRPALGERLAEIDEELSRVDEIASAGIDRPAAAVGGAPSGRRRRRLVAEREQLLEEIRGSDVPALAEFGRPASAEALAAALGDDTAIIVNISDYRCDVLVVTLQSVRTVHCPGLSPAAVRERLQRFDTAFADMAGLADDADDDEAEQADQSLRAAFHELAGWLWDEMAERALRAAGLTEAAGDPYTAPRVWWIPTGELARFPVHAAGRHADGTDGGTATTVASRVVSSYATSLTALHESRRLLESGTDAERPAPGDGDPAAVVVAMPSTPALGPDADLEGATDEVAHLLRHFPTAIPLVAEDASRGAVLAAIRRASILHLACHATSEPTSPDHSRLFLHDGELAIADLLGLPPWPRGLAYLSACQTADVSGELPDEAIHLASAFQLLGFGHTVATTWPVPDDLAVRVCGGFYGSLVPHRLAAPPADPAAALHVTIAAELADDPLDPLPWAYVHFGTPEQRNGDQPRRPFDHSTIEG